MLKLVFLCVILGCAAAAEDAATDAAEKSVVGYPYWVGKFAPNYFQVPITYISSYPTLGHYPTPYFGGFYNAYPYQYYVKAEEKKAE